MKEHLESQIQKFPAASERHVPCCISFVWLRFSRNLPMRSVRANWQRLYVSFSCYLFPVSAWKGLAFKNTVKRDLRMLGELRGQGRDAGGAEPMTKSASSWSTAKATFPGPCWRNPTGHHPTRFTGFQLQHQTAVGLEWGEHGNDRAAHPLTCVFSVSLSAYPTWGRSSGSCFLLVHLIPFLSLGLTLFRSKILPRFSFFHFK